MKRRASVPDEQLALEGLVSLSSHHTTTASSPSSSSATAAGSLHLASHLPWNVSTMMSTTASHDDKPASENKHHHHHHQFRRNPQFASSSASLHPLSSAPPSESKMTQQQQQTGQRGTRSAFSAKDALKDALEHSTANYTSIHPPSSFFASTTSSATHGGMLSTPTSPLFSSTLSSPRSSFSLPPLSATLASLHSTATATATTPSPSPRSSFSTATPSTSSSTPASSSRRASISASTLSDHKPPAKRTKLEHHHHHGATASPSSSSPMSSPRTSFSVAAGVPMMDDPPEDAQLIPVTARIPQGGEVCIHIEKPVLDALTASGISPESIVDLIVQNDKESRDQVIRETGFSTNYIMKLQRRVLHSSSQLQLPPPVRHSFGPGVDLHVLFDSEGGPLFMKKELCTILGMKGTTFSYWKKKSNVEDTDTSKDFRLMDICRTLFGGRATYTLYSPTSTLTILNEMETSRQKNSFSNLAGLKFLVTTYGQYGQRATKLLADPNSMLFLDAAAGEALSAPTAGSTSTTSSSSSSSSSAPATATPMSMMIGKTLDGASAAADAVSAARSAAC